jgi:superfamily II DNA/RNA helicase
LSSAAAVSPVPVESTPTFAELGVPAAITARLAARSILHPFPIQAATLVDALAGRDVSGKAPTGSGKTIAFGIPLVAGVERAKPRQPRGLVLVPTRELAEQVCVELRGLAGGKPSVSAIFGGVGFGHQTRALRKGVDIVVACPGRLADLINQREISLHDVSFVVIDEADRMADMGFLPEVKRLLDQVRDDRQTLLFSATLDGAVDELVRRYQHDPVRHEHDPVDEAPPNRHVFWNVDRGSRINTAAQVIKAEWPAIVFCRTKHGADRVAKQLGKAGVTSVAMHGDRSQSQRKRALADFTDGRAQALVATDVAARGIHVDDVASVIHFDPPADEKDYVHRSGRTGRAGASGVVVSFIADDQVGDVRKMQRRLGMEEGVGQIHFDDLTDDHLLVRPAANGDSSSPGKGANGNATSSRARNRGRGRSGAGDDRSNRSAGAGQARRDDGRGSYGSRSNGTNGSRSNGAGNGSGGAPRGSGEGRPRGARSASVTGTGERSPDWSPEGGETGRQKPRNGGWSRNGSTNGSGGGRPGGKPKKRTARAGAPRNGQGGAPARAGGGKPGSKGPKAGGRPSGGRPGGSSSNRSRRPAGRS